MRRFSSYGPIDREVNYYAPRKELIDKAYTQLFGENPMKGGHYITVWAPRQTGKTWLMQQILFQLQKEERFDVLKLNLEIMKDKKSAAEVITSLAGQIGERLGKNFSGIDTQEKFQAIFKKGVLDKPLVLILDEFDALREDGIGAVVSAFRNIHNARKDEIDKSTGEKTYLLHGVALIGVRSVLGIENPKGSPFNVQRSLHVPNLTYDEVKGMFQWYEKESGQAIDKAVIDELYDELRGQPGLTCWFGELLTETYNHEKNKPITMDNFEEVYAAATYALPSTNILNLISKVKPSPYKEWVLELFRTDEKIEFKFDDDYINYLYTNGVIDQEKVGRANYYVKFSCPFVQKRLFNYFSGKIFDYMGQLVEPFENLDDTLTKTGVNFRNLMKHYGRYLNKNRDWLFKDVPRRKDLRIYEAVYHFNLYMYLFKFLKGHGGAVFPEFPTGNGKIDLVVHYKNRVYGLELKSFTNEAAYKDALLKAAQYGKQLGIKEIALVFFVEFIDDAHRETYEKDYLDKSTGVTVNPIFIATGR